MWDVINGTLWIFCLFTLMGLGTALLLFKHSFESALATAPTLGLINASFVGTYLVLLDLPIIAWSSQAAFAICALSLILSYILIYRNQVRFSMPSWGFFFGLGCTSILLLAPILVGGLSYTVLKGNGTDTFNYIIMGGYLTHEPLSWVHHASAEALINKHPAYGMAFTLFDNTRWSTAMLLGWTALLAHVPLYRFEFGFTVLFFIMAYGCTFCLVRFFRLSALYQVLLSIAICVGFWGQFVLDIRAMSQINILPLFLFLAWLIMAKSTNQVSKNVSNLILGLAVGSVALLYVEILPLFLLGCLFFFLSQLIMRKESLSNLIQQYWLALVVCIIALIPASHYLYAFLVRQIVYATHSKNDWDIAYFNWLYQNPLSGFLGLTSLKPLLSKLSHLLLIPLAGALATLVVLAYTRGTSLLIRLSLSFILAGLCEWLYLYCHDQLWAAGKAVSYVFPFIFLFIAGIFTIQNQNRVFKLMRYSVLTWIVIQCGFGFYRIHNAAEGKDYRNYISNHGYYLQHTWEIDTIAQALKDRHVESVALHVSDPWLTEYLALALGWEIPTINLNGVTDRGNNLVSIPASIPEYCILKNEGKTTLPVIASTPEFILIRLA